MQTDQQMDNGNNMRPPPPHFSKLKEFAEDNSKFHENGWKFSKEEENIKKKGQIACYD